MYIPTLSLEITLTVLLRSRQSVFRESVTFLNVWRLFTNCLKMTDLKNIIKVLFPDDGVSVICVTVHAILFFLFIFIFILVGMGMIVKR